MEGYRLREINLDKLAEWIRGDGRLEETPALHLLDTIRVMREQNLMLTVELAHAINDCKTWSRSISNIATERDTLTAERLTMIGRIAELVGEPLHYCIDGWTDHYCGAPAVMSTQSTTCWDDVTCAGCLSKALQATSLRAERLEKALESARSTLSMGHTVREREAYSIILEALAAEKGEVK